VPAGQRAVPPPLEVSATWPFGLTPYSASFQATMFATAVSITCVGATCS
jgi:hypothetical protein